MRLRLGTYWFPPGAVAVATARQAVFDGRGLIASYKDTFTCQGWLVPTSTAGTGPQQAELTTMCRALEQALLQKGADLVMYRDDGGVAFGLLNATSLSGVRITSGPNYPNSEGAEFVNYRTFSFTAEADYPAVGGVNPIINYEETLTFSGGGPLKGFLQPVNGLPIRQTLFAATPYLATQSGSAVALGTWPIAPGPIWPGALLKTPDVTIVSPKFVAGQGRQFPVSWAYTFGSAQPLQGRPHIWPGV